MDFRRDALCKAVVAGGRKRVHERHERTRKGEEPFVFFVPFVACSLLPSVATFGAFPHPCRFPRVPLRSTRGLTPATPGGVPEPGGRYD